MRTALILLSATSLLLPVADRLTAQGLAPTIGLAVTPPSPGVYGQPVTLRARPPTAQTTYRFVATMIVTGTGKIAAGTSCATPQNIGTGTNASWTPASGAYRLTVRDVRRQTMQDLRRQPADDSASVSYQVDAPNHGVVNITIMQNPNPQPPGQVMLSLRTTDRGAGNRYQWVVRFTTAPGTPQHPPVDWIGDTPSPVHLVPLVLSPGTYHVSARVGIHSGDPCRIVETSRGVLANTVIQ